MMSRALGHRVCLASGDNTYDAKGGLREGYLDQSACLVDVLHQHPPVRTDICPGIMRGKCCGWSELDGIPGTRLPVVEGDTRSAIRRSTCYYVRPCGTIYWFNKCHFLGACLHRQAIFKSDLTFCQCIGTY